MADNTVLNAGSGGDTFRTEEKPSLSAKVPVSLIDVGGTADAEAIIGDAGVAMPVRGLSAENAAVSGNPVLIGGRYDAAARTLGDGDVGAIALDPDGAIHISDGGNTITVDGSVSVSGNLPDTAAGDLAAINAALGGTLTVGLPTGAATAANQATAIASLAAIEAAVATEGSALGSGVLLQGDDGTDRTNVLVDTSGHLQIDVLTSALPSGAATAANQATGNASLASAVTALQVMDDWDESDRAKVNAIVGQAGVAGGAGAVGATTQRVTLASDDPGVALLTTIDADTGNAVTALQRLDDSVATISSTDVLRVAIFDASDTQITSFGGGTQYTENDSLGSTPTGTLGMMSRDNVLSTLTEVEGDAVRMRSDGLGALWVRTTEFSLLAGSSVAHDAADANAPHKIGAKAVNSISDQTLVADDDRTDLYAGVDGVQIVRNHCNLEDIVSGNASNTDGSSEQVIAAQGAGIKTYLTHATITNTSSAMVYVEVKDGTTTKHTVPVPAEGGATIKFDPPLPGTANTAWNFDASAATTTLIYSAIGFKSKV